MSTQPRLSGGCTPAQTQEAAEWFLIIHDAHDVTPELLEGWTRWLNASEGNRSAYQGVEQAYHLATPSLVAPLTPQESVSGRRARRDMEDDYDGSMPVAEWLDRGARARGPVSATVRRATASRSERVSRWVRTIAAAVAVMAVTTAALLWRANETDGPIAVPATGTVETLTGEHKELVLADGSRVTLGARSSLSTDLGNKLRIVRLERGEAYFSVQKDPRHPFVVHAPGGTITAVGTAFNVRATRDRLTVAVTEGSVRVVRELAAHASRDAAAANAEAAPHELRVSSGQQVSFTSMTSVYAPATETSPVTRLDVDEAVRWRAGWLVYRNEPLRYVLADIARYTDLQLDLSESVSDDLRFSGAVFKDDVPEWLTALPRIFPLTIRSDGRRMIIGPRAAATAASEDAASGH